MSGIILPAQNADPMSGAFELPLHQRVFPLGFPLDLSANHSAVAECARESWGAYPPRFDTPAIQFRVLVNSSPVGSLPPPPAYCVQGHLMSAVSDSAHFAMSDYPRSYAFGCFSEKAVCSHDWFRWYFLEAVVYSLLAQLYLASVHAACVALGGRGVLLCGESGAGKTSLSYACARRGWTFLSDDSSAMLRAAHSQTVLGKPHQLHFRPTASEMFPELRGKLEKFHPNGKATVEVPTTELDTAFDATAYVFIFLNRTGCVCPSLKQISSRDAFERIARDLPFYSEEVNEQQMACLRRLSKVPAFELQYGALDSAVDKLESLLMSMEV
jgi:hypothetical protein